MIPKGEGHKVKSQGRRWHYLAVKKLSALLKGITLKNNGDFSCLNCLHSFELHEKVYENKDFCKTLLKTLEY